MPGTRLQGSVPRQVANRNKARHDQAAEHQGDQLKVAIENPLGLFTEDPHHAGHQKEAKPPAGCRCQQQGCQRHRAGSSGNREHLVEISASDQSTLSLFLELTLVLPTDILYLSPMEHIMPLRRSGSFVHHLTSSTNISAMISEFVFESYDLIKQGSSSNVLKP